MKIKKSQLKQLIKEELEATMDEGFLDKLMGRTDPSKPALIYFPKKSIVELTPRGPGQYRALVKLYAPKGRDTPPGSERMVSVDVNLNSADRKSVDRLAQKLKKLNINFMIADPSQPAGFDSIETEVLAGTIHIDIRRKAQQQETDEFIDKEDAEKLAAAGDHPRNQGYQYN
tara:strand:+ start:319 stop:834 length:516 start_codon:yes stop_codon:yes gene_type:complete